MRKITSESFKLNECRHLDVIDSNGFLVCRDCGLVLERILTNGSLTLYKNEYRRHSKQYVSPGDSTEFVGKLGTHLGFKGEYRLRNYKGSLLSPENQKKFNRLKKKSEYISMKSINSTDLRILTKIKLISNRLELPLHIWKGAALRFKKLSKYNIINKVTCACFCVWDAIRFHKHYTTLKEVLKAFYESGSRVNGKLLIRDGCLYSEYLKWEGLSKSKPKEPADYITPLVNRLRNAKEHIEKRLSLKNANYESIAHYFMQLETFCYRLLKAIAIEESVNPLDCACSAIYSADLLLARFNEHKPILTQSTISKFTYVSTYSIRDHYIKLFKEYLTKIFGDTV